MADGVTPDGFVRPRLPEIRLLIVEELNARLRAVGYPGLVETRPDSLLGLIIDTFADRETALWEQAEAVYFAMYPSSASGAQLDLATSFAGVFRLNAAPSSVYSVMYGTQGTTIPAGTQVRNAMTQSLWQTAADVTIGLGLVGDALLRPFVANTTAYTVTINGTPHTYTSDSSATLAEILAGIAASLAGLGLVVTNDGATVRVRGNGRETFALQVSVSIVVDRIGAPVLVRSVDNGAVTAEIGELTQIVTLVPGLDTTSNLQAASIGRQVEIDAELRERYKLGVYLLGAATLPAIEANLLAKVSGVTSVKVFENATDTTDTVGRPPHSIHAVVENGLSSDIAETIFRYKAAGIDTYGAQSVTVTDDEGVSHTIKFDRPTPVNIWIDATITLLPASEEAFPADGFAQIKANLLAAGDALGVGQDVIWQRFLKAVHAVPGVAEVTLTFAHSYTLTPGTYSTANVTIADFEVSRFDFSRINVH